MKKKILFVSRHAPYGNSLAKEALDALLAASAYDQDLTVLFMDDGVFQLLKTQEPANIEQKNFAAIVPALFFYDIEKIYVHKESLLKRNISIDELAIDNIFVINSENISLLFNQQDQLLSF